MRYKKSDCHRACSREISLRPFGIDRLRASESLRAQRPCLLTRLIMYNRKNEVHSFPLRISVVCESVSITVVSFPRQPEFNTGHERDAKMENEIGTTRSDSAKLVGNYTWYSCKQVTTRLAVALIKAGPSM